MERFIAIDDVCAWPNLTRLPDNTLVASIFNQPCHGTWEGDIECWGSTDGGLRWQSLSIPAPHAPGTNHMHVASGLAHDDAFVVLSSGWTHRAPRGQEKSVGERTGMLPWVSRSSDGGRSWHKARGVTLPEGVPSLMPYGDIIRAPDGTLGVCFYSRAGADGHCAYFLRSRDDGFTWGEPVAIAPGHFSETALFCVDEQRWLAAGRAQEDGHIDLVVSDNGGLTWSYQEPLTLPGQHPAHLLQLLDGRLLLVYGIRNQGLYGVAARLSEDQGRTWGAPILLVDLEDTTDGGYPCSAQTEDGTIVTVYYSDGIQTHRRWHMGAVRWRAE
jgi:hypothetical protein